MREKAAKDKNFLVKRSGRKDNVYIGERCISVTRCTKTAVNVVTHTHTLEFFVFRLKCEPHTVDFFFWARKLL